MTAEDKMLAKEKLVTHVKYAGIYIPITLFVSAIVFITLVIAKVDATAKTTDDHEIRMRRLENIEAGQEARIELLENALLNRITKSD